MSADRPQTAQMPLVIVVVEGFAYIVMGTVVQKTGCNYRQSGQQTARLGGTGTSSTGLQGQALDIAEGKTVAETVAFDIRAKRLPDWTYRVRLHQGNAPC